MCVLCGCSKQQTNNVIPKTDEEVTKTANLPLERPLDFHYSSGVGAWWTTMTLKPDGTFVGTFQNSELGDMDEEYPHGTVYIAEFNGEFTDVEKIDDYSYLMKLSELKIEDEGKEYIEEKVRYVITKPYGLEGNEFVLYVPETPVEMLNTEFLDWKVIKDDSLKTLSVYGLENKSMGIGFFSY